MASSESRLLSDVRILDLTSVIMGPYTNVQRWVAAIAERPAVKRGRMVNRLFGELSEQLHERHDASDFDLRTEDKIRSA